MASKSKATPASIVLGLIVLGAVWLLSPKKQATQPGPQATTPTAPSVPAPVNGSGDSRAGTSSDSRVGPRDVAASPDSPEAAKRPVNTNTNTVTSLTIASWNIEWLGKPADRSGEGRGVAQDPADLAEAITRSGAAIVALQEISPTGSGSPDEPRSSELDAVVTKLGGRWSYLLFPSRSGDQFTGFLWNTERVSLVPDREGEWWRFPVPTRRSSQGSGLWVRPPTAVKFAVAEGKTDFVLVVVHMKADYEGDFAKHRAEEASELAALLPDARRVFKDKDLVVIGDTNMTSDNEPAEKTIEAAGLRDLNTSNAATHWRGGGTDKIFVPADQPEFTGSSFRVINHDKVLSRTMSPAAYKRRFSDHYMVTTTLKVQRDDD